MVGGNDFGDRWVVHALHGGPLIDLSVKKGRRWAPTEVVLCRMWATGHAVGGLPLSVETPSEIVGWRISFSLRLSKDLLRALSGDRYATRVGSYRRCFSPSGPETCGASVTHRLSH